MIKVPTIYCAATDEDTLNEALALDTKVMSGHIFGIAGLVIGLSCLRNLKAFALLVDTLGMYPDVAGTKAALAALNKFLGLNVDLSGVIYSAGETKKALESFGLVRIIDEEKKKEDEALRWYI